MQRVLEHKVGAGEKCRKYASGQYVRERSVEDMTTEIKFRKVAKVWKDIGLYCFLKPVMI